MNEDQFLFATIIRSERAGAEVHGELNLAWLSMCFAPALILEGSSADPRFCTMVLGPLRDGPVGPFGNQVHVVYHCSASGGFCLFFGYNRSLKVCFACMMRGWKYLLYCFLGSNIMGVW